MTYWKSGKLVKKSQCPKQVVWDSLFKSYTKSVHSYATEAFYMMLNLPFSDWTESWIMECLEQMIPNDLFSSNEKGRWVVISNLQKKYFRFRQYAMKQGFKVLAIDKYIEVSLSEIGIKSTDMIQVHVDVILQSSQGVCYLLKTSTKKTPFLKTRSKTELKNVNRSMDLYLMTLAARQFEQTEGYPSVGVLVYFRGRDDKFNEILPNFNVTGNDNWIESVFPRNSVDDDYMEKWLLDLMVSNRMDPWLEGYCESCHNEKICNYQPLPPLPLVRRQEELKKAGEVNWTKEQLAFINCESGIYRANAVAGSGKTTVVANRLIQLLLKGHSAESFILITFTEKGVQELKEKISYWLSKEGFNLDILNYIQITTFNSFGYQLIQTHYDKLGFTKVPRLIDKIDKIDIIRELTNESPMIENLRYDYPFMQYHGTKGAYLELSDYFDRLKKCERSGTLSNEYLMQLTNIPLNIIELYRSFIKQCLERNLVDYDDQITLACKLLQDMELIEQLKYRHIIVDEFQDTNPQQLFITQQLSRYKQFCSLLVCGDDSQSIYSFRDADQSIILNFKEVFPQTIDLHLTNNFRSTKEIAYVANQLNAINKFRLDKEIVAHKTGDVPCLWRGKLEEVARKVDEYIDQGIPLSEIAIIGRHRKELVEMHNILKYEGIPSTIVVSELLKDNMQIQRVISLARYLKQRDQERLLFEYLQFEQYESFTQTQDLSQWFNEHKNRFISIWESLTDEERLDYLLDKFRELGEEYRSIQRLMDIVEEKTIDNLNDLLSFIDKIDLHDSDLRLDPEEGLDAVVLTTAHSSKGREFEVVILLISTFRIKAKEKYDEKRIEEERRVLFVGITRAKQYLEFIDIDEKKGNLFIEEIEAILNQQLSLEVC